MTMSDNDDRDSILFVDDEPPVLEALRRLLADEDYQVRTTTDPGEVLQEVVTNAPTVVVADYYMPGMQGPELLRRIREIDESIVRIVLTGKPDVTGVLEAVKQGSVYRFILKPWDRDELVMSLRQAIDYHGILIQRNNLLAELDRQRQTLESLEKEHPGITKLTRAASGALVLDD